MKNICERLLLKSVLSPGLLFLITSGSNWYLCFSFRIIIYRFVCSLFTTIDTAIIWNSLVVFCKKGILQISQKSQEKSCAWVSFFRHRCFLEIFAKFLKTPFLKNPSDSCFCIKTRSVQPQPFIFLKTILCIFSGRVFSLLNLYRTRTKVSLIFYEPEAYIQPSWRSAMEVFCENS